MKRQSIRVHGRAIAALLLAALIVACATSPTGRRQLLLMPEEQMAEMGKAAFTQLQQEVPLSKDPGKTAYVRCVTNAIVSVLSPEQMQGLAVDEWRVEVFADDSANAFALPGGRIGVHTGMLDVATTPSQLAAVIGHEIGHVLAQHGNARVSNSQLAQTGLAVTSVFIGGDPATQQQLMGLLGAGVEVGVLLPFSRGDESEADQIGIDLMARAGFDPRESVTLWQNMSRASSGGAPIEFMSTHPSHTTRIAQLQGWMDDALVLYQQAQAAGRKPSCRP